MQILVAGAGIVGVSTAIWLQRAGHDVTLLDRQDPGTATSYGNAGVLAAGAVIPVTTPGLMRQAPAMLINPKSPLFLRWSYLPKLLPFLAKYLTYATPEHVSAYAKAMFELLHDSVEQHQSLAKGTKAAEFISTNDYCFGYATHAAFEADAYGWAKRKEVGVQYEVVSAAEYQSYDPIYGPAFETIVRCKLHGQITDPGAYLAALADHFIQEGGTWLQTSISDIDVENGAVTALRTEAGLLKADKIVFAMGPWSKEIARKLGVKVPFEVERGYHIELVNPSVQPRSPMMVAAGKFVITPMQGRIRAAGIVEFGGLHKGPSAAPINLLKRSVAALLPNVTYDRIDTWMGHRPAPASSLPLIGANDASKSSYSAFGHQHVGLTGGPRTGRLIAQMISGAGPNMDMAPFDPLQYRSAPASKTGG